MKRPLPSCISLWGFGILFAAFALVSCQKTELETSASDSQLPEVRSQLAPDGGAITELLEMHKTGFGPDPQVLSLREASVTAPKYKWEINRNNSWVAYTPGQFSASLTIWNGNFPYGRVTKLRRAVETPSGLAYSNECTVINYAFQEDPRWGTDTQDNAVKLGPYSSNFSESLLFETRGEYFQDLDRLSYHGNDAYMTLNLTQGMFVEIITGSIPMFVRLSVWSDDDGEYKFDGNSSSALFTEWGTQDVPFPTFDVEFPGVTPILLYLNPGEYRVQVQGCKSTNGGTVNYPISISLRGTVADI